VGYETKENVGSVMIENENDNSVPWELIESIENIFNCTRYHLG